MEDLSKHMELIMETFALVAKMNSLEFLSHVLLIVAGPWKLDVTIAFLHEIYMEIPPGFSYESIKGKVCNKASNILKQSPRVWFEGFHKAMIRFGYKQSNAEHMMFLKHQTELTIVLIVYVDYTVIPWNEWMNTKFEVRIHKRIWTERAKWPKILSGYCIFLGGNMVIWRSKKQSVVSK